MVSKQNQSMSTIPVLEPCVGIRGSILTFVRSLREADFDMYLDTLWELLPWFFALDHTHYARWIPVHLRDMMSLHRTHPDVLEELRAGMFKVQKTNRTFSSIAIQTRHMTRIMHASRETEELLVSWTIPMLCRGGWLLAPRLQE